MLQHNNEKNALIWDANKMMLKVQSHSAEVQLAHMLHSPVCSTKLSQPSNHTNNLGSFSAVLIILFLKG